MSSISNDKGCHTCARRSLVQHEWRSGSQTLPQNSPSVSKNSRPSSGDSRLSTDWGSEGHSLYTWIHKLLTITESARSTDGNTDVPGKGIVLGTNRPGLTLGSATYWLCRPEQFTLSFKVHILVCEMEIGNLPGYLCWGCHEDQLIDRCEGTCKRMQGWRISKAMCLLSPRNTHLRKWLSSNSSMDLSLFRNVSWSFVEVVYFCLLLFIFQVH